MQIASYSGTNVDADKPNWTTCKIPDDCYSCVLFPFNNLVINLFFVTDGRGRKDVTDSAIVARYQWRCAVDLIDTLSFIITVETGWYYEQSLMIFLLAFS
jgi:hypothetical protein